MKQAFHLIGIGGIGMSALARILLQKGFPVSGSDVAFNPLLEELQKEGVLLSIGHRKENVPFATVVYSSAVKEENPEKQAAKERGLPLWHRSDLLDFLSSDQKPLLVTGTHGKTTTTALLAYVLDQARWDPSFVIGGIAREWKTNGRWGQGQYFVAEADESDGSFLKTEGFGAIVTNCDQDHLDYWKEESCLQAAFQEFCSKVKQEKFLFWCADDPCLFRLHPSGISYGFTDKAMLKIDGYRQQERSIQFSLAFKNQMFPDIELSLLGRHNALNGSAVFGLALSLGVGEAIIRKAFASFKGTERRLEQKGTAHGVHVFDDYAHHPAEIATTLQGMRSAYATGRIVVVFQPHRFTRTRDLWEFFPLAFESADCIILTEIYGAMEVPIPGISSDRFYAHMQNRLGNRLHFAPRRQVESLTASLLQSGDWVVTMGAGDITKAGESILSLYKERMHGSMVGA